MLNPVISRVPLSSILNLSSFEISTLLSAVNQRVVDIRVLDTTQWRRVFAPEATTVYKGDTSMDNEEVPTAVEIPKKKAK